MRTRLAALGVSAALVMGGAPCGAAESGGLAGYSAAVKRAAAGHLAALGMLLRREVPYEDHLLMHAEALRDIAAAGEALYPPGMLEANGGDAADEAREARGEFEARLAEWRAASEAALEAARQNDLEGFAPAFRRLAESCRACHAD